MQNMLKHIGDFIVSRSCTTNHKQIIATLYMLLGRFSRILGMVLSISIRFELAHEGNLVFKANAHMYTAVVTSRTLVMIFFFVMPILIGGFGNWMILVLLGAPRMTFPQLNNLSFGLLPGSFYLLTTSMFLDCFAGNGILYLLLTRIESHTRVFVDLVIATVSLMAGSCIVGATTITIATILGLCDTGVFQSGLIFTQVALLTYILPVLRLRSTICCLSNIPITYEA